MRQKCPGQDTRYWKPDHIYNEACPICGKPVEFFKDDWSRRCSGCGTRFKNPRLDIACAKWCPFAADCIDSAFKDADVSEKEKKL